jgi:hypothetical protein
MRFFLFNRSSRVFTECPNTAVSVTADEMVSIEFHDQWGYHAEELLDADIILRVCLRFNSFVIKILSFLFLLNKKGVANSFKFLIKAKTMHK